MYTFVHTLPIESPPFLSTGVKNRFVESILEANVDFSKHLNADALRWILNRIAIETPSGFNNRVINIDGEAVNTKQMFLSRAKAIDVGDLDLYMSLSADLVLGTGEKFVAGKLINPVDKSPAWFLAKIKKYVNHSGVTSTSYVMLMTIDAQPHQGEHCKWFDVKIDHSLMNVAILKTLKGRDIPRLSHKTISALGYILPCTLISLLEHQ